ncbi:MAG: hypothetical protein IT379_12055, partial [Deltaproteobacteria bacterium]|nr:hypothetical protein [Deltaproteobacteria bacterium]
MTRHLHRALASWVVLLVACGAAQPAATPSRAPASCPDAGPPAADAGVAADASAPAAAADETVVFDGIPDVPASLTTRVNRYLNTRSAWLESMSDDGRAILITTRFHETPQLHRLLMPGGDRQQITFAEEPIGAGELVPGDGDSVLYTSDVGGNEQIQLYRL